jgi:hypothetical protein
MKPRRERRQHAASSDKDSPWPARLRSLVLGGAVALIIIATLIPSESAVSDGAYAPIIAGWCLLLVAWAISLWLDRQSSVHLGWTELAGAALVGWHSLASLVSIGSVNGRQALNVQWLLIGYGLSAFLIHQSLRSAAQVRTLVTAMLWLATLLATFGFYQYFYSMPRFREQYLANPEKALIESGVSTEKSSPQREQFENRLRSVEPLGTFALTNSLAGFLAPWLIAALAIAIASGWQGWHLRPSQSPSSLIISGLVTIALAGCLLLTKSRTALLATIVGVGLLALFSRQASRKWHLDWRVPAIFAAVILILALVATYSGGLDQKVFSEAPKSVLYRLEYWQSTAAMIRDHPLFGCGPGNFQEAFAAYKLPEASETVSDPHNFLLEIWATAGTPALVLLLLHMVAIATDLLNNLAASRRMASATLANTLDALSRSNPPKTSSPSKLLPQTTPTTIFVGALAGLILAAPLAALVGFPLESTLSNHLRVPVVWLLGLPLLAACWLAFRPWIAGGYISLAALLIPQFVLLVNLFAAGAIVFPGVIGTFLVLAPASLYLARPAGPPPADAIAPLSRSLFMPREVSLSRSAAGLVVLAALVLTAACLLTEYAPVLYSRARFDDTIDALHRGDLPKGHAAAMAAAQADPLWPEPWRLLAEIHLQRSVATNRDEDWQAFTSAAESFTRLNPHHHAAWYTRGNWHLTAWRKRARQEDLDDALAAYRRTIERYPNKALYHAQLAWMLHLSGAKNKSLEGANIAKRLDDLMPHREQKLSRQQIADPQITSTSYTLFHKDSAELIVEKLRTTGQEIKP